MFRHSTCCLRLALGLCLAAWSSAAHAQINVNVSPGSVEGAGFGPMAPSHDATIAIHSTSGSFSTIFTMINGSPSTMWLFVPDPNPTNELTISGTIREDEMSGLQVTGYWMDSMMMSSFNVHVANVTFPCKPLTCDLLNPMGCVGVGGQMCDPVIEGELAVAPGQTVGTSIRVCNGLPGTLTVTPDSTEIELLDANGHALGPLPLGAGVQSVSIQIRAKATFTGSDRLTARFVHTAGGSGASDVLNIVQGTPAPTVEIAQIIDTDSDPEGMEADDVPPLQKYVGNGLTLQAIPDTAGAAFSPAVTWTLTSKPTTSTLDDTMPLGTGDLLPFTPDAEGTYSITATSGSSSQSIAIDASAVGILEIVDVDLNPEGDDPDDTQPLRKLVDEIVVLDIVPNPRHLAFPPTGQPQWNITFVDEYGASTAVASGTGRTVTFAAANEGDYFIAAQAGGTTKIAQVKVAPEYAPRATPQAIQLDLSIPLDNAKVTSNQPIHIDLRFDDADEVFKITATGRQSLGLKIPNPALEGWYDVTITLVNAREKNTGNRTITPTTSYKTQYSKVANDSPSIIIVDNNLPDGAEVSATIKVVDKRKFKINNANNNNILKLAENETVEGVRDATVTKTYKWRVITTGYPIDRKIIGVTVGGVAVAPADIFGMIPTSDMEVTHFYNDEPIPLYTGVAISEEWFPWRINGVAMNEIEANVVTQATAAGAGQSASSIVNWYLRNVYMGTSTFTIDANHQTQDRIQQAEIARSLATVPGFLKAARLNKDLTLDRDQKYYCPGAQLIGNTIKLTIGYTAANNTVWQQVTE